MLHVPHAEPLACGFVRVADGQPAVAAALARTVLSRADNLGQPCAHTYAASSSSPRASQPTTHGPENSFASADEERSEIGAHARRHITRVLEGRRAA